MNILKAENAIVVCQEHLKQTNSSGTEVETYLTKYLIMLISSCFEEELEKIFIERSKKTNDQFLIEFFKSEIPQKLKSVGIAKLSELIKKFGNKYEERFKTEISLTSETTFYTNIIRNRHLVAHETKDINMTFQEVVDAYRKCNVILDRIKEIIEE